MLIESLLSATFESSINVSFLLVIFGLFIFALVAHGKAWIERFVSISPTLLTGIGILGTFLGIFIALQEFVLEFDVDNIKDSISPLLEGMEIAFISSIWGMLFGIIIRFFIVLAPIGFLTFGFGASKSKDKKLSDSQHFLKLMEDISKSSRKNTNILNQLNIDANRNHEDLKKEFQEFAEKVTENSSKALVEALEEVIRDFNTKISEQLGDNFKKFNEALGKLLEWQDSYKEHIAIMEEQFKRCTESIVKVEKAMTSIKSSTDSIPEAIEKLPSMLEKVNKDVDELQETLEAFASMKGQAMEAFPVLDENLKKLTSSLEQQVTAFESILEAQRENYRGLKNSFDGLGAQAESAIEQLKTEMTQTMQGQREKINEIAGQFSEQMQKEINNIMAKIQKDSQESINQSVNKLEGHFEQFDVQMQGEIKRAIEQMGSQLASLSDKFVSDYSPLTEKLQTLVKMAENFETSERKNN